MPSCIRTGFVATPPGLYLSPWRKVKTAEPAPGWWNMPPVCRLERREWTIETECGHFAARRGLKPPKRIRCKACMPELVPGSSTG